MAGMRVALAVLLVVLVGCGTHRAAPGVRLIQVSPTPEGPSLRASTDTAQGRQLIAAVADALPSAFPPNPSQQCHLGTTIEIVVATRTYSYGPCDWPSSIERLRRRLIAAAGAHQGNAPSKPVSAAAWKAVLSDWYDGRMDHWHSCRAVREALRHLPADPVAYSTVFVDLEAYARGVCR